jgi:large subunit ribosomal protein L23
VERAFKVEVTAVNVIRLPAKSRRIGRYTGHTPAIKKAIVTLKAGQSIAAAQP